ncbi:hypothetical protein CN692_14225 [Bacillus sp. AFS002410]|uniref:hypothetical protein n=1 Tax=Bacillus sp. AFS002410 TaxID=2033481 RepID=UPI000BF0EE70|nr:hypothetical protein [Bacillus sp. AFS002410]PEJ57051.1 hypothetical protein CN692_14225 [Bacillus sp. AFS002410]
MYEITIKETCNGFFNCLEPADKIQIVAVFIALIAAGASFATIFYQRWIDKKNKEAIIVPGIKSINANVENILSDWEYEDGSSAEAKFITKQFSRAKIPIWNYGGTPIFNIGFSYQLENEVEFFNLNELHKSINNPFSNEYYDLAIKKKNEDDGARLIISNFQFLKKNINESRDILPFIRTVDSIMPNQKAEIVLPDYFIILLNNYFLQTMKDEKLRPILKLSIVYDDINFHSWRKEFRIFIPNSYRYKGSELTTSFHYEIIQDKKKVKRFTAKENEEHIKKQNEKTLLGKIKKKLSRK